MTEAKTLEMSEIQALLAGDRAARRPNAYERVFQPCVAELLGTAFFVFIGCASVIEDAETTGRLQPALVHGLAVAVMVACMAEISGSHFNPCFTLAIYLCGGVELCMVPPYLLSQLVGGVLGAWMAKAMTSAENYGRARGGAFALLRSDEQLWRALFGEAALTCLLTVVVLLAAVNGRSRSPLAPLVVGCAVTANVLAGGGVSGTCMNSARAFGPALVGNYWSYHWVYWVGPIGGALVATALVRLLLGDRDTRIILK